MTDYIVGSDKSGGKDQECINKICEVLKSSGNNAESIGVNSNLESSIRSKGKGKTAVFMVNGVCIGTFDSHMNVVKSGLCDYVWFAMPQSINPSNEWLSEESCQSKKVPIAHDDNFTKEPRRSELNGKYTIAEYCEEYSQYVGYACGKDCEEVAQKILSGGSGGSSTGTDSTEENKSEPTPMSYLDMIKDLVSVWDGDVEVKVKQDKMYINKISEPKPQLWVVESNNIVSGSAKITDYNSDTINTLNVHYNNNTITITDEYLINRFGEVSADIDAEEIVTDYSNDSGNVNEAVSNDGTGKDSDYTKIAKVLQEYYQSNDWNSFINNVRFAKTREEVRKLVVGHKFKDNKEKSHNEAIHKILVIKGLE